MISEIYWSPQSSVSNQRYIVELTEGKILCMKWEHLYRSLVAKKIYICPQHPKCK